MTNLMKNAVFMFVAGSAVSWQATTQIRNCPMEDLSRLREEIDVLAMMNIDLCLVR